MCRADLVRGNEQPAAWVRGLWEGACFGQNGDVTWDPCTLHFQDEEVTSGSGTGCKAHYPGLEQLASAHPPGNGHASKYDVENRGSIGEESS